MRAFWPLFLAAAVAAADDVILVSGGEVTNCRVVHEGPDEIVIDRSGTQMVFRRSQVLRIIRREVEEAPPRKAPPPPPPSAESTADRLPAEPAGKKRKSAEARRIKQMIAQLASTDETDRDAAKSALLRFGEKAYPELAAALTDNRYWVRFYAARIFREHHAREAAKALLEALNGAVPDRGRCPSWNKPYVRAVRDALRAATGKNFGLNPDSQRQGQALAKWVEWWAGSYGRFPRQIGEEELDPESENYKEELKEARKLNLRKKQYPRPPTWQPATPGER